MAVGQEPWGIRDGLAGHLPACPFGDASCAARFAAAPLSCPCSCVLGGPAPAPPASGFQ
ncbi:hypothetical protein Ga0080559_TMP5264 (plasmid) [Salipiger profundus]|uniref:Uncharacterized protein n=1 Tax=Salipiger profundus TaxID=1229727 RepID=A0A1U7DDX0_9RHOB|nr:hypothetical protein Ga0080559_TMP5264 [Salipiger profundus]